MQYNEILDPPQRPQWLICLNMSLSDLAGKHSRQRLGSSELDLSVLPEVPAAHCPAGFATSSPIHNIQWYLTWGLDVFLAFAVGGVLGVLDGLDPPAVPAEVPKKGIPETRRKKHDRQLNIKFQRVFIIHV